MRRSAVSRLLHPDPAWSAIPVSSTGSRAVARQSDGLSTPCNGSPTIGPPVANGLRTSPSRISPPTRRHDGPGRGRAGPPASFHSDPDRRPGLMRRQPAATTVVAKQRGRRPEREDRASPAELFRAAAVTGDAACHSVTIVHPPWPGDPDTPYNDRTDDKWTLTDNQSTVRSAACTDDRWRRVKALCLQRCRVEHPRPRHQRLQRGPAPLLPVDRLHRRRGDGHQEGDHPRCGLPERRDQLRCGPIGHLKQPERAPTKGNPDCQSTRRTQSRESVSQAATRIRKAAERNPKERLTALFH